MKSRNRTWLDERMRMTSRSGSMAASRRRDGEYYEDEVRHMCRR